ncbi:hypothetical protein KDA23_07015 [Candidatus Saccharibacteria bacterium]|nr:hypothetical protein [Candidatus Saccharibacteria bacterium]
MQPNTPQSGNSQDPAVGQAPFNSAPNHELPEVDPTNLGVPPTLPSPTPPATPIYDGKPAPEDWSQRIQHAMMAEANPRQRAARFAQLKNEYQQNVLGISPQKKEEPKQ